jgi:hypothetical protein
VSVDWFGKIARVPVGPEGRGALLASGCTQGQPVGVMLHHAVMSVDDLTRLGELLEVVVAHPHVSVHHLHHLAMAADTHR